MPVLSNPTRSTTREEGNLLQWMIGLLLVFNVLVPKGGILVGGIPLTWGYALLGLCALIALPRLILSSVKQPWTVWFITVVSFPLQAAVIYSAVTYPIVEKGFAVAILTIFIILPIIIVHLFGPFWSLCNQRVVLRILQECIFYAAVYGIFLFLWYMQTGKFIEIPYITINAGDVGTLGTVKENLRSGHISKLISTYTNGNIYGICTLMFLPLFDVLEGKRNWRKLFVRVALVLTLSRSVWFALIFAHIAKPFIEGFASFPRLKVSTKSITQLLMVVPLIGLIVLGMLLIHVDTSFLLPSDLGGRSGQFEAVNGFSFLPPRPLEGIEEVVYASVFNELGLLGLFGIVLLLFGPLLLSFADQNIWRNPLRRAALFGTILYAFLCAMDGAMNYIPTMTFWWFLVMILTRDSNQTHSESGSEKEIR